MNHPFRPEKTGSLSQQLYEHLFDRICRFELRPNQKLSEAALSDSLGVSRTPAREALARLAEQGLVDILPQRGTRVAPLRLADLETSQFMREALELAILRRAMEQTDRSALLEAMRNEITLQRAYVSVRDKAQFYASDNRFHGLIATFAGCSPVIPELTRAKLHMDRFRQLMVEGVEDLPMVIRQHEDLVTAIETGDKSAAEDRLQTHLRRIFAYVDEARARFPEYFEEAAS
ncbi:GntR family transcriptional regulator [Tabrizicola sp. BL-A-41-H6]|uniref:GntR family transcriptional regulator n=1 Tax=Tabrizicola sp. BL-A-41-H6 TaxID=3421107 RepID=UPI003D676D96